MKLCVNQNISVRKLFLNSTKLSRPGSIHGYRNYFSIVKRKKGWKDKIESRTVILTTDSLLHPLLFSLLNITCVIVVVVEVKDEEWDEASQEANDGHADVVAKCTLGSTATHFCFKKMAASYLNDRLKWDCLHFSNNICSVTKFWNSSTEPLRDAAKFVSLVCLCCRVAIT